MLGRLLGKRKISAVIILFAIDLLGAGAVKTAAPTVMIAVSPAFVACLQYVADHA